MITVVMYFVGIVTGFALCVPTIFELERRGYLDRRDVEEYLS
jgi:hypothetical protein